MALNQACGRSATMVSCSSIHKRRRCEALARVHTLTCRRFFVGLKIPRRAAGARSGIVCAGGIVAAGAGALLADVLATPGASRMASGVAAALAAVSSSTDIRCGVFTAIFALAWTTVSCIVSACQTASFAAARAALLSAGAAQTAPLKLELDRVCERHAAMRRWFVPQAWAAVSAAAASCAVLALSTCTKSRALWWVLPAAAAAAACVADAIARGPFVVGLVTRSALFGLIARAFGWVYVGRAAAQAPALELQRSIEAQAIAALHRGTHHCAWETDPYAAGKKQSSPGKRRTNELLQQMAAEALARAGTPLEAATALVLDAESAESSRALITLGWQLQNIHVPNLYPHVVSTLRANPGVRAFVGDVSTLIGSWPPELPSYLLVYLDFCGGVWKREGLLREVFERHMVRAGGTLALGFSFRDAGKQAALIGSAAAASVAGGGGAVAHCTQVVTEAAAANGYSVREAGRLEYDGQFFIGYHVFLL